MSHFSIAGLQLALPNADNLATIEQQITGCKKRFPWVDMIVLSELASFGPSKVFAQEMPGAAEEFYCKLAKELDIWIIPGSLYEKIGNEIFNTAPVINPDGDVINRYRKIYPFYPYEKDVSEGTGFVVFDVPQGRIGLAICYDIWFPEVARAMVCQGAEILIYPTMTGTIDRQVEVNIALSTAAINQSYVIAVNGSGDQGNGQSVVVSPDGQSIHTAGIGQEIFPIEFDFNLVRRARERGLHQLGQPLKSFRNNKIVFPQYQQDADKKDSLDELGPLTIPQKEKTQLDQ
jgi:predicted amidohydrolase